MKQLKPTAILFFVPLVHSGWYLKERFSATQGQSLAQKLACLHKSLAQTRHILCRYPHRVGPRNWSELLEILAHMQDELGYQTSNSQRPAFQTRLLASFLSHHLGPKTRSRLNPLCFLASSRCTSVKSYKNVGFKPPQGKRFADTNWPKSRSSSISSGQQISESCKFKADHNIKLSCHDLTSKN